MIRVLPTLLWSVTVFGALALLFRGLEAGVYFEPTGEAIAEARWGSAVVGIACCVLVAAAGYAVWVARWPSWVGCLVLAPVVLCGGLTVFAPGTLLAPIAVVVAYPMALAGVAGGLIARVPARPD